ncbi:MAG: branched-chain amino acid ABC transporter permease [Actinomycetota bacterium]
MRTGIVSGILAAALALLLILGNGVENGPNPFVVLGIVNGAVFGLVALGLVLVYKGTRVFNFAQGEFGTLAAFIVVFALNRNLPYFVAVIAAILVALLVGLAFERVVVRPLMNSPRISLLVATIAFALLAIGFQIIFFKAEPRSMAPMIEGLDAAGNPRGIDLFGLIIEPQRLVALGVLIALGGLLAYFFSRTDLGLAVLATSQDAFATRVVGIGVERMSRFIWGAAAVLGAIAGILYVPLTGALVPAVMTSNILIPAFTAAVLGGMTSLPGAFVGGVVIGVVQAVGLWAGGHFTVTSFDAATNADVTRTLQEIIPGVEQVTIFLVLLVVLLARPSGLLGRET